MTEPAPPVLDLFMSHRYRAPEVNQRVFDLVAGLFEPRFYVDAGLHATLPARLERMIREADGFVGVFPLVGDPRAQLSSDELLEASRYCRLELDMAARARKPSLVVLDRRFGNTIALPRHVLACRYEVQDLLSDSSGRAARQIQRLGSEFVQQCRAAQGGSHRLR